MDLVRSGMAASGPPAAVDVDLRDPNSLGRGQTQVPLRLWGWPEAGGQWFGGRRNPERKYGRRVACKRQWRPVATA